MTFKCEYCLKEFVKETSLAAHLCEPKRRALQKDEPGVRLGFQAYVKFYAGVSGSAQPKTYAEFAKSAYYKAFVKFGRYCVDIRAVNPAQFMAWLLKTQKKIDYWCSDKIYTEYLMEYLRQEAVDDALTRAIEYSMDWEEKTQHPARDCLRFGNINATCYAVTSGRISPWVIYNSESGQKFLSSLSPEQVIMIWPYIDSDIWQKRFREHAEDQAYAQQILTRAGW